MEKMTTEEAIAEVNNGIREGLRYWSDIMILADADQWAVHLKYFPSDLMNATLIFQHVASNIGIKAGKIDEKTAKVLGDKLRRLVIDMTGYDPHVEIAKIEKDMKEQEEGKEVSE
jgi:hypothetical protein